MRRASLLLVIAAACTEAAPATQVSLRSQAAPAA